MSGHAGRLPGCTNALHGRHQTALFIHFRFHGGVKWHTKQFYVVITFKNVIFGYVFDVESRESPSNDVRTYHIER